MKRIGYFAFLTFLVFLVGVIQLNAQSPSANALRNASAQEVSESGRFVDGVYANTLLGVKVKIPSGWEITGDDLNKKAMDTSRSDLKANETASQQKAIDKSLDNTRILFMAKSTSTGGPGSVGVLACGIEKMTAPVTQMQYSVANKTYVLKDAGAKLTRDVYSTAAGGVTFTAFEVSITKPGATFHQVYMIMVKNNFAFFFVVTDNDEAMRENILDAVKTLSFQP